MFGDDDNVASKAIGSTITALAVHTAELTKLLIAKGVLTLEQVENAFTSVSFGKLDDVELRYFQATQNAFFDLVGIPRPVSARSQAAE